MDRSEFSEITLRCTEGPDVRFTGKQVAESGYSETFDGKFVKYEFSLFVTLAGIYVGNFTWTNSLGRFSRSIATKDQGKIFDFFGCGEAAKTLYDKAGLEFVVDVE